MTNLLDTVMNIEVFAFIGLLVWLYFKRVEEPGGETSESENGSEPK
jgi:hypothetical protein